MKGLIFYFSGTGTTKLAVEYISSKIKHVDFDFHDMSSFDMPSIENYSVFGFATFAKMLYPPKYVEEFIQKIKIMEKRYAFVFNTYGSINGNTLKGLGDLVTAAGFTLIDAYALRTPESSPKMILSGITSENAPNEREFKKFHNFIKNLDAKIVSISKGKVIKPISLKKSISGILLRNLSIKSKYINDNYVKIGEKYISNDKCIHCGKCQKVCPSHAIHLDNQFPRFDENKCDSCFICFNLCPSQAIFSDKYTSGHYSKPNEKIAAKLSVSSTK